MVAAGNTSSISDAKESFRKLLIEHKGDAKHPEVKAALDTLIQLAANDRGDTDEWSPTHNVDKNKGHWRTITTPPFGGKLDDESGGKTRFTLGRMSFGMFKPTALVCAVDDIVNIIEDVNPDDAAMAEEKTNKQDEDNQMWSQTYDIDVLMQIETPSGTKLPARLINYGVCFPKSPTRLGVKFTQGTLQPNFDTKDTKLMNVWKEIFDQAIAKEAEAQSYISKIGTYIMHTIMYYLMGLEPPTDNIDYTQTFRIGKPFIGHLDILYLDANFRVTKGSKGTIVVVERVPEKKEEVEKN